MTKQEQQDLHTPGYKAYCERRWIELQQSVHVDGMMEHNLRRHQALRFPKGTRRRTDATDAAVAVKRIVVVKRFDSKGRKIAA